MKGWEALKALEEGKKVRVKSWSNNEYIYKYDGDNRYCVLRSDINYRGVCLTDRDLCDEWEIYEESDEEPEEFESCPCCKSTYIVKELTTGIKQKEDYEYKIKCCGCGLNISRYIQESSQISQDELFDYLTKRWNTRA